MASAELQEILIVDANDTAARYFEIVEGCLLLRRDSDRGARGTLANYQIRLLSMKKKLFVWLKSHRNPIQSHA